MEFIDLHSIFKDIGDFLCYFNKTETPIICFIYNTPIRFTLFNKIANDMQIDCKTQDF